MKKGRVVTRKAATVLGICCLFVAPWVGAAGWVVFGGGPFGAASIITALSSGVVGFALVTSEIEV